MTLVAEPGGSGTTTDARSASNTEPLSTSSIVDLGRGERVDRQSAHRLLRVVHGLTAVSMMLPDGRRQILCLNTPNDVICPICSGDCWIEALGPTRLEVLPPEMVDRREADTMKTLFELTHERLAEANIRLTMLGRLDGAERVAVFLADMCARLGAPVGQGALLTLSMSREDIADYLGLNSETVSRIFTRMKRAGLVRFPSRTEYLVPDLAALAARAPIRLGPNPDSPHERESVA